MSSSMENAGMSGTEVSYFKRRWPKSLPWLHHLPHTTLNSSLKDHLRWNNTACDALLFTLYSPKLGGTANLFIEGDPQPLLTTRPFPASVLKIPSRRRLDYNRIHAIARGIVLEAKLCYWQWHSLSTATFTPPPVPPVRTSPHLLISDLWTESSLN